MATPETTTEPTTSVPVTSTIIGADRFNAIKARVKAECQRRAYNGSVSAYGGTDYDYTVAPETGKVIQKEHYEKLAVPLNAINSETFPDTHGARIVNDDELTTMEAKLTVYESRSKTDNSNNDCAASCTGLCISCTGTCTGTCSTSCSGICENSCNNDCYGGCKGKCDTTCTSKCQDSCDVDCWTGCWDTCKDDCTGGCELYCEFNCSGACYTTSS